MIPQDQRKRFRKDVLSDGVKFDMNEVRKELKRAKKKLARSRARNSIRPKEGDDPDFLL